MTINFLAVIVCAIASMIVGFVWFGPIFGKKWMQISGATDMDLEKRKEMQRKAMPLYFVQFLLTLFQLYVLAWYISYTVNVSSGIHTAFSIWIAFVMPTLAGSAMWNNDAPKVKWAKFLIQAGYQLVIFIIFGFILGIWK